MGIVPKSAVVDNSLCKVPWLETRVKGNRPKYYNRRALSRFSRPLRGARRLAGRGYSARA
ncbi:hypothetical protein THTE_1801 [Thermogutta terrifontis]|uniref:Uncharacterized protein n=1 Tax=Thermogutta terrifontis TaxID=1331910 RepID=A0A286REM7_9BACT|nr:hypothetical protein THTE_1801 [Thermogutta terrifontis]